MSQQLQTQRGYTEADVQIAVSELSRNQIKSIRRAGKIYNVPERIIRRRRDRKHSRRDCEPNCKRLTKLEEEAITRRVIVEAERGLPCGRDDVRDMANRLLRERGGKEVGKNWVDRFVQRNPELRTRQSRPYDHQRALCEDPVLIKGWFELVQNTKAKYGIVDEDIYNFDETGFIMGKILSQSVITGSDKPGRTKQIQPGNREWVTLIQGVGATGTRIPAFLIFAGKVLISTWFTEDLPRDWVIQVSPTGWTNNDLALDWLRHFDSHARPVGTHRLLIIDGHESHCSVAFRDLCEEMKIILLCMPPHSSHLLQPLDVGCFSPLKRAYGDAISVLARNRIHHISKETFLPTFKEAYSKTITADNIRAGFRGAGLVPHNSHAVLSQLDVVLRTPTPPAQETTTWEPKTPRNAREMEAQATLVRNRMQIQQGSPTTSLKEQMQQLSKGAQQIAHNMVLMQEKLDRLEATISEATKRKTRKRRYVQAEGSQTVSQVANQIAEAEGGSCDKGATPAKRVRSERRCGRCSQIGHNSRTCQVELEDTEESDASEE